MSTDTQFSKNFPAQYSRSDLSGAWRKFLHQLEQEFNGLARDVDAFSTLWDILNCEGKYLPYLAQQRGYELDSTAPLALQRKITALLVPLYKQKGTAVGVKNIIKLLLGLTVTITAPWTTGWKLGISNLGVDTQLAAGLIGVQPGFISTTAGSPEVVGSGTSFDLLAAPTPSSPGTVISFAGRDYSVLAIADAQHMTLASPALVTLSNYPFVVPYSSAIPYTFYVIFPRALSSAELAAAGELISFMKRAEEHHVIVQPSALVTPLVLGCTRLGEGTLFRGRYRIGAPHEPGDWRADPFRRYWGESVLQSWIAQIPFDNIASTAIGPLVQGARYLIRATTAAYLRQGNRLTEATADDFLLESGTEWPLSTSRPTNLFVSARAHGAPDASSGTLTLSRIDTESVC